MADVSSSFVEKRPISFEFVCGDVAVLVPTMNVNSVDFQACDHNRADLGIDFNDATDFQCGVNEVAQGLYTGVPGAVHTQFARYYASSVPPNLSNTIKLLFDGSDFPNVSRGGYAVFYRITLPTGVTATVNTTIPNGAFFVTTNVVGNIISIDAYANPNNSQNTLETTLTLDQNIDMNGVIITQILRYTEDNLDTGAPTLMMRVPEFEYFLLEEQFFQTQLQEIKFDNGTREFRKLLDNSVVDESDIDTNTLVVGKCPEVVITEQIANFEKFVTNTITGLITEIVQQTNLTTGSVAYYTNAGVVYTLIAGDAVADYPIRVVLADALPITVTNAADAVLTMPTNAAHAEIHVYDNGIVYTVDGSTPDATAGNGIRINVGGTFELEGADELSKFKARSLSATNAKIDVVFTNIPTPAE